VKTMKQRIPSGVKRRARQVQQALKAEVPAREQETQTPSQRRQASRLKVLAKWEQRGFAMPAPKRVKWSVLRRHGRATDTWIETGTYRGDTTAWLAKEAAHVWSIEPEPTLAKAAMERFADNDKVTIAEGLSEDRLPEILAQVEGPVSFWLDGHFSAGVTHRGPADTPIREELAAIEEHLPRLGQVRVLVDDLRCFEPSNPAWAAYPTRGWLVAWAERNQLNWTIEHDIFAAWS
jgi:hypothetical protein